MKTEGIPFFVMVLSMSDFCVLTQSRQCSFFFFLFLIAYARITQ